MMLELPNKVPSCSALIPIVLRSVKHMIPETAQYQTELENVMVDLQQQKRIQISDSVVLLRPPSVPHRITSLTPSLAGRIVNHEEFGSLMFS